jgi:penicillin-binding protein 1B
LEDSLNVPTVRAAQRVGLEAVIESAQRCGIRSELPPLPSLSLGTAEVTALELATAFGVFANGGERVDPWIIRAVVDRAGRRLEGRAVERRRAIHAKTAREVNELLEGVLERGTAKSAAALGFRGRAAGKTGTTDETRDAWFVGYSGDLLALVWVGHDDNLRTGLTGATGALPLWVEFMAPDGATAKPGAPEGMTRLEICAGTGLRATGRCPETREEWFSAEESLPGPCTEHMGRFRRWWRKVTGRGH